MAGWTTVHRPGGLIVASEWYEGELGLSYLVGGVAMVLLVFYTLSAYRSCVVDEPKFMRTGTVKREEHPGVRK